MIVMNMFSDQFEINYYGPDDKLIAPDNDTLGYIQQSEPQLENIFERLPDGIKANFPDQVRENIPKITQLINALGYIGVDILYLPIEDNDIEAISNDIPAFVKNSIEAFRQISSLPPEEIDKRIEYIVDEYSPDVNYAGYNPDISKVEGNLDVYLRFNKEGSLEVYSINGSTVVGVEENDQFVDTDTELRYLFGAKGVVLENELKNLYGHEKDSWQLWDWSDHTADGNLTKGIKFLLEPEPLSCQSGCMPTLQIY